MTQETFDLGFEPALPTQAPVVAIALPNPYVRAKAPTVYIPTPKPKEKDKDDPAQDPGWYWVDGLCYRDPEPLCDYGTCNNGRGVYYYYTGPKIVKFLELLEDVAQNQRPFVLDFETGPCKTAPVDPRTGAFDLSRLAYSTHTDTNISGSDPHTSVVFLAAISIEKNVSHVIDVREAKRLFPGRFERALGEASVRGKLIAHNAVFECTFIKALTGYNARVFADTMIFTRLLYAGLPDPAVPWVDPKQKLGRLLADADSVLEREMGTRLNKRWQKFFLRLHPETGLVNGMIEYVASDTALMLELAAILIAKLKAQNLYHLWTDIERPFLPLLAKNRYEGVPVNIAKVIGYRDEAATEIDRLEREWYFRHPALNYESQPQILEMFQYKYPRRNIEAVDEPILSDLVEWENDDDAKLILDLRQVKRVHGTYLEPWIMTSRNPITGNIHCEFSQNDTSTARMCIARGTPIEVLRDVSQYPNGVPIENVRPGDWAYTYDRNLQLTLRRVLWAGQTGHKKVIRLHWEGQGHKHTGYLDLTPEHPVRLTTGEYRRTDLLKPGDRILALHRSTNNYGYARLYATNHKVINGEHRFVAQEILGVSGEHIHHEDENRLNNIPSNLTPKTASAHIKEHQAAIPQPIRHARATARTKRRHELANYENTPRGENHPGWIGLTKEWMERVLWENQGKPTEFRDIHKIDYETVQKYLGIHQIDYRAVQRQFNRNGQQLTASLIQEGRKVHEREGQLAAQKFMGLGFYRWKEVQAEARHVPYNHKITHIEILEETIDVYDLEIEESHNFIASELCVHNSSKKPNLQNIPAKSHWNKIRTCFMSRPGYLFCDRDLSQFEVRALASMAGETGMIAFFERAMEIELQVRSYWTLHPEFGYPSEENLARCQDSYIVRLLDEKKKNDFHTLNAIEIYNDLFLNETNPDEKTRMRKEVKALTFAIPYGTTAQGVAINFKISVEEAQVKIDRYYRTWQRIAKFLERCEHDVRTKSFNISLTGRKRFYPSVRHFPYDVQKRLVRAFERQAKNFPIQSINGDVLKLACVMMAPFLDAHGASFRLWVHDEILVEVPEEHIFVVATEMERCMIEAAKLCNIKNCPIETSCNIGNYWSH